MADFLENVARSVPTLFYDAVARICPGTAFLFFVGKQGLAAPASTGFDLMTLVVGGYIVGVLLTVASSIVFDGPLELLSLLSTRLRGLSPNRLWDQIDSLDVYSERHAMLLAKIDAEMTLCQNLFVAFVALIYLQRGHYLIRDTPVLDVGKPLSWTVGVMILASVVHRTLILYRRVNVLSRLVPTLVATTGKNLVTE